MTEMERRLTLRLMMTNPEQRAAWEIISSIPKGSRIKEICRRLLEYENRNEWRETMLSAVRQALDERGGSPPIQHIQQIQQHSGGEKAGEISKEILGFCMPCRKVIADYYETWIIV